ncbi:MAG: hypothetical protein ABI600_08925, partial [Luteolibacter sp.]
MMRASFVSLLGTMMLGVSCMSVLAQTPVPPAEVLPERVFRFPIKTRSDLNKEIPFYLRVPLNFRPGKPYRLLFLCPHLNQGALAKLNG